MLGAIIGDIAGSRFEWNNIKSKDFALFGPGCFPTDDSYMTLALAEALAVSRPDFSDLSVNAVREMQLWGRRHPDAGYGSRFREWLNSSDPRPYNSLGNGAAMRVSPAGFAAETLSEAKMLARMITEVTHNHPEGLKAAEAVASAIFLARAGLSPAEIRSYIDRNYYSMDFTLDEIRPHYRFDVTCHGSVPQAFMALFESSGFEDAIRNAISIGGDSDTIAAIAGGMAEAVYGIPPEIRKKAMDYLDEESRKCLAAFKGRFPGDRPLAEQDIRDSIQETGSREK
ncbi:MAG: ADP-ribosylglycohydrolase family protein [Succinimonas sp.]|nr:ADP-ribosylglycohydrolase family protein [Succinimonas sp.]MEE3423656.1 ADP-ribosylglycohydrolase family protein [Succinimonas sp.]